MSGSSRKFNRRQWRSAPEGAKLPPEWAGIEACERARYAEVLDIIKAKMPGRGFALITCPPSEWGAEVSVEAIGYISNIESYDAAVEIFHALEERWRARGMAVATVMAPVSRAASPEPAAPGGYRRRVQDLWADFEASILSDDFSDVQRREMRRSFYAGAFGLLDAMGGAVSAGEEETEDDQRMLGDLAAEREEYILNLQLGRA